MLAVDVWNDETAGQIRKQAKALNLPYKTLVAGQEVGARWGVRSLPTNYLLDRSGTPQRRWSEITNGSLPEVRHAIEQLIRDKP